MKKIFALLLALAMTICLFAACTVIPDEPLADSETVNDAVDTETAAPIIIKAADCYDSMYYSIVTEKSGSYTFTARDSENATWDVYVFDEEFSDGLRYISQAAEPVLSGDGTVTLEAGKYVYVYCSVNGFTADAPDESAYLEIVISE